jgi:serine/threonine protein kinase
MLQHLMTWLCRFFTSMQDFLLERSFYQNETFRHCLPEVVQASENGNGCLISRSGFRFPPFLALDRGVTLNAWMTSQRGPSSVLAMIAEVLELLVLLHSSSYVHRDLKPDNLLLVLHTQKWKLMDFGIATASGV